ncbi:DegT/DnrJ/EryC1/StrS family aminotransferase [Candidatus Nucleicultrix amoebiphila]|uniref:DegT/DnrJ/EryC1/StrS family aminotransferase n=1 Tax=Candidatus Nucleicultrix amoebiphila TaxID=1509244 RepID=UPI0018DB02AF|nr:DegT/DnrJ/EryC1/StrS family aminotransferase [Candidatus Nucleicultrix amoebiphila]
MSHAVKSISDNTEFLPFARPSISEEAIADVVTCLRSGWLVTGPKVQKFEEDLKNYLHCPYAHTLTSATAGLFYAVEALGIQAGDEVITTPMTFAATANSIAKQGAKPVFVDVEPGTYNMDVNRIEDVLTSKTKAIMPVHFSGLPVDLDPLYALAKKHNLRVIEDAAHAIGAEYKGKKIGSFGDIQIFSFYANKTMTTGEGGCLTCADENLAKTISLYRFHGIDRPAWNRFGKNGSHEYEIVFPGYKANMMDIQAALGIHQLKDLDSFIEKRQKLVTRYYEKLGDWSELKLPESPTYSHKHGWHLFAVQLLENKAGLNRDQFMAAMKEENIGTALHYKAVHLFPYYQNTFHYKRGDFPHAEAISDRIVSLPLFPTMTEADQDRVIKAMGRVLKRV